MGSRQEERLQQRTYIISDCVAFRKTNEAFGGLSNMAPGFPLVVNSIEIPTSEHLYQTFRFPDHPDVQQLILQIRSPMTAKMKSKPHRTKTRSDWDQVRVRVMRWCLRVKLAQNWEKFVALLESTKDLPIVESSRRDAFWGAKPIEREIPVLVGINVLGRLLVPVPKRITQRNYS